ncbi:MAG: metal ABC transporter ATP-binding protein [Cyanobacteria bacterium P01_A01_bin.83]
MLEVCDLSVNYRHTWAVEQVSFTLQPGQVTGLLGPNGAGKSTLVKAILGLVPSTGKVTWQKRPLSKQLNRAAYVPQRSQIDWNYPVTVERAVMMGQITSTGWLRQYSRRSQTIVNDALKQVGVWQERHRQISELSGGQQQRVFLARAIAQEADFLLLDEPFNNVDRQTETIIFDIFQKLKAQQKTLLVISHDLSETLNNYDQLLLLNKKLIASGKTEEVLSNANINQVYKRSFNLYQQLLTIDHSVNANLAH